MKVFFVLLKKKLKWLYNQAKRVLNIEDDKNSDQNNKGFGIQGIEMFY